MNVHVVTVVGAYAKQLPLMLNHYRRLGVKSFIINVHTQRREDPLLSEVERIVDDFGCKISSVSVGGWSEALNEELYNRSRPNHPGDWFVIADLDEFQVYPGDLLSILEECDRKGYDYIEGCFIDRISADGSFIELCHDRPIEDQFPLGCIFTYRILGGVPLKIVAARGHVRLGVGNHSARNGIGCPVTDCYVQVHHYKWVKGIADRIQPRSVRPESGASYMLECRRLVEYCRANHGRIDVTDPRLLVSECKPEYKYWNQIKTLIRAYKESQMFSRHP